MNNDKNLLKRYTTYLDLLIIIVFAVLLRIVLYYLFDYQKDLHGGDSAYYLEIGHNMLQYGVHGHMEIPSFYRPPLYSLFAGIIANISETALFFYCIQSFLFIAFSVVVYFLMIEHDLHLAFYSSLLIAISPFDALLNGRVLGENLVTPLIVTASLLFINSKKTKLKYFLSGVLLGGAVLCRDIFLLLPILYVIAGLFSKIKIKYLSFYILGFLLIIVPWCFRNSQLPNGGIFISKGIMWQNLWIGTWMRNADFLSIPGYLPPEALQTYNEGKSPDIVMTSYRNNDQLFFKQVTIQYIAKKPFNVLKTWIYRYPRLWLGTRSDLITLHLKKGSMIWYSIKSLLYLFSTILIAFGLLGIYMSLRIKRIFIFILLPIVYTALIYLPFYNAETRYSQPVMPILTIFFIFFFTNRIQLSRKFNKLDL